MNKPCRGIDRTEWPAILKMAGFSAERGQNSGHFKEHSAIRYMEAVLGKEFSMIQLPVFPGLSADMLPETQRAIWQALDRSPETFYYSNAGELLFELETREKILYYSRKLSESGAVFAAFQDSFFNPAYWIKTRAGYALRPDVRPSEAVNDVFSNGSKYAFECSTAIVLILYKAVLESISVRYFNQLFQNLLVWDWNYDRDLGIVTKIGSNFIPGDIVYFYNPDFRHPVWTGENAVYLGNDAYFGHGIGIKSEQEMVAALNTLRKPNATRSAFLISQHSRINFRYLFQFAKRIQGF
ncbi:protein-glutamine gamma-glutamyltransferase [Bacillus infantis]|nr:protein-glutamine gamma-glutamyltransferase [Bacillus infantis]